MKKLYDKVNIHYKGNRQLKRADIFLEYTPDQIREIKKCKDDIDYFLATYVKIIHLDKGLVPFKLYPYQKKMIKAIQDNLRAITLAPRQSGKSVGTCGYLLHHILFNKHKTIAILANKGSSANKVLYLIKQMYTSLPVWLQQGVVEWNKGSVELENGTRVIASSTSSSAIRGESVSLLYIDECIEGNTEITIRNKKTGLVETIKILDLYLRLYHEQEQIDECDILLSDEYEVLTNHGWEDFEGIKKSKSSDNVKLVFSDESYIICTNNHLIKNATNAFTKAIEFDVGDIISNGNFVVSKEHLTEEIEVFDLLNVSNGNEYITNNITSHNCAFIQKNIWDDFYASVYPTVASSKTSKIILSSTPFGMNHYHKLWSDAENKQNEFVPVRVFWQDVPGRDEKWKRKTISDIGQERFNQEFECMFLGSAGTLLNSYTLQNMIYIKPTDIRFDEKFRIYKRPVEGRQYVVFNDVAEGLGQDASSCQVIDVTDNKYEQVAVYEDDTIKTNLFPAIIKKIAEYYNDALAIVENNGIGDGVLNDLHYDLEYENIFYNDDKFGLRMTKGSKNNGNSYLKSLIEENELVIHDENTIDQFSKYIKRGNTYKAEDQAHDDLITPLVLFSYFINKKDLVELWLDKENGRSEKAEEKLSKIEEELLPIGFMTDGDEDLDMCNDDF